MTLDEPQAPSGAMMLPNKQGVWAWTVWQQEQLPIFNTETQYIQGEPS